MTEKNKTVYIDDVEYDTDTFTDEQKTLLNHVLDLDRKLKSILFNADQIRVGKDAFLKILTSSLKESEELEAEVPEAEIVN